MPVTSIVFKATPAKFYGRAHLGAISGVLSMLNVGSTAIGPLLVGASFDQIGSYHGCIQAIAVLTFATAFACLQMRAPTRQRVHRTQGDRAHDCIPLTVAHEDLPRQQTACTTKSVVVTATEQATPATTEILESNDDDDQGNQLSPHGIVTGSQGCDQRASSISGEATSVACKAAAVGVVRAKKQRAYHKL